jgi:hypothetical protein
VLWVRGAAARAVPWWCGRRRLLSWRIGTPVHTVAMADLRHDRRYGAEVWQRQGDQNGAPRRVGDSADSPHYSALAGQGVPYRAVSGAEGSGTSMKSSSPSATIR